MMRKKIVLPYKHMDVCGLLPSHGDSIDWTVFSVFVDSYSGKKIS